MTIKRIGPGVRMSKAVVHGNTVYTPFQRRRHHRKPLPPMANPKRKQSKRRSANRRAANAFRAPEFAKDPTDGTVFRPHRVNPKNGMYRGRQVLNVEV